MTICFMREVTDMQVWRLAKYMRKVAWVWTNQIRLAAYVSCIHAPYWRKLMLIFDLKRMKGL